MIAAHLVVMTTTAESSHLQNVDPTTDPTSAPRPLSRYLTPAELAAFLDHSVTEGTLRNYRSLKVGPTYITVGRKVFYPIDGVYAWIEEKTQAALRDWPRQA